MSRLVVAGGGTGGHVLAGIAVADEWKKQCALHMNEEEARHSILFVGSHQGLEAKLVPQYGYSLKCLPIGALNRVSFKTKVITLIKIPVSILQSIWIILKFKPDAVIGVGGYASGPLVLVARVLAPFLKIKTAILEQNSVAGFTNRLLGKWTHLVFCAFEGVQGFSPGKVVVTGNPIRSNLTTLPVPVTEPFTLFIFGGSQGAYGINSMVLDALPFLKNHEINIIHQTGVKDFERVKAAYQREGLLEPHVRIEKFIQNMKECYEQASLVICRSGSSTLSELASVGRAAIFIPLPTAADNHQEVNARVFEKEGGAWVVRQGSLTGQDFANIILKLKNDPEQIATTSEKVKQFYKSKSAELIVRTLLTKK